MSKHNKVKCTIYNTKLNNDKIMSLSQIRNSRACKAWTLTASLLWDNKPSTTLTNMTRTSSSSRQVGLSSMRTCKKSLVNTAACSGECVVKAVMLLIKVDRSSLMISCLKYVSVRTDLESECVDKLFSLSSFSHTIGLFLLICNPLEQLLEHSTHELMSLTREELVL